MGIFRGSIVLALTLLLFVALFFSTLFLTLNWSLNYNDVQPYIKNITITSAQNSGALANFENSYPSKRNLCQVQESANITFMTNTFEVPCSIILKGENETTNYVINETAPGIYSKNYTCQFLDCIKQGNEQEFLLSQAAKNYWGKTFTTAIIISLIIFVLLFLFTKRKYTAFVAAGIGLIVSEIPFTKVTWLLSLISGIFPFKILPALFGKASAVFTISFILGIILIAFGIGFNLFKWGRKISEKINSTFKTMSKEEKKLKKDEKKAEDEQRTLTKEEIEKLVKEEVKEDLEKKKQGKKKK